MESYLVNSKRTFIPPTLNCSSRPLSIDSVVLVLIVLNMLAIRLAHLNYLYILQNIVDGVLEFRTNLTEYSYPVTFLSYKTVGFTAVCFLGRMVYKPTLTDSILRAACVLSDPSTKLLPEVVWLRATGWLEAQTKHYARNISFYFISSKNLTLVSQNGHLVKRTS